MRSRRELTSREKEVYELLVTKLSIKQIAQRLGSSQATIKTQRSNIYEKLNYSDRLELVIDYYEQKLQFLQQFILDKGL